MMRNETLAFLTCVLPAEGTYCAVIFNTANPRPGVDFPRQQFCASIEELTDVLLTNDKQGRTVYHACASYRDPKGIWNERKQKWEARTQANALAASAFWLDIDAGRAGAPFPSAGAAAEAVVDFCSRVLLPRPLFVGSGSGLHCYWPLEQSLAPDVWQQYADGLKALCVAHGLKADPARTADIASILRPPGTYNRKAGEQLVRYDTSNCERHAILEFAGLSGSVGKVQRSRNRTARLSLTTSIIGRIDSGTSYGAVYADDIADRCAQLGLFRTSGNIQEPLWYAGLGVLGRCEDGEVKAHEWSAKDYPDYSPGATTHKLDRARQLTGATTCEKFDGVNPGVCQSCPLYQKINSPISAPVGNAHALEIPRHGPAVDDAPQTFSDDLRWSLKNRLFTIDEIDDEHSASIVAHHPVYLMGVQTGELDSNAFSYRFTKSLPREGWSVIVIEAKLLHGNGGIADMFGKGVVIHDGKMFLNYARHAVDVYHSDAETAVRYDQFGWKNDNQSFLFGKMLYTSVGPVEAIGAKEVGTRSQWLGPKKGGSVQAWTNAADALFASDMEAFSAVVLASFAAPLMKFQSQDEGGAIIHLFTPSSGMGKTTALTGAWTVWGTKEALALTNDDTRVSKPIAIGTLANLPIIYDELRDRDPEVIRRLVVMFTEGRDRMRGTIDGTIRHTKANWQTILLSAANNSLIDQLQGDGVDAPAFRVLELSGALAPGIDKTKGDRLKRIMNDNAGHAGDAYLRYLMNPEVLAWTKQALEKWTQEIWDSTRANSAHRFRVRAIGAIAVAAALVNKLGILHFQTDRIVAWLMRELGQTYNKGTVSDASMTSLEQAISSLGEFINDHYGETIVVADRFKAKSPKMIPILKPHNRLSIRYEIATGRVFLSESVFRDWAIKKQLSPRTVLDLLEQNGVIVARKRGVTLSAGTDVPGAQVSCIEANATHPVMSGLVLSVTDLQGRQEADGHNN